MTDAEIVPTTGADVDDELHPVAEAIVEEIERPETSTLEERGPDGWLPKLDLPGFGEEGETCGEEIPHFCDECGKPFPVGRTCSKSSCPRCAPSWVKNRAGTSREDGEDVPGYVAKLDSTARMMAAERDTAVYKHHLVFSPPYHSWFLGAEDPLDRTFKVIRGILRIMDAEGIVFYHPWAGDNEDHEEDDRGKWKDRLFSGRDWEDDVRHELKPRGHFHAVVCSPNIPGGQVTADVHEETGWIIKRVTKHNSKRSLESLNDVASAVNYCLSHTGLKEIDGHNYAQVRKYGSTYDRADPTRVEGLVDRADHAVRKTAPRTLGIEMDEVACYQTVAPEDAAEKESHDHDHLSDVESGNAEDEPATAETVDDVEEVELVRCDGAVRCIDDAPHYLEDAKWRAEARHSNELQTTFEDWEDGDGWPGG